MLIHQTLLDIQTKGHLLLYKVTIKNPPYGDKDSLDQCRYKHQYQKKTLFLGILGPPYCVIGATIRIGREMLCLPYAGFLIVTLYNNKYLFVWISNKV